jgi:predicted enzyme related to lactoylglutathione lyase
MANQVKLVVYPAKDLDKAKKYFDTFLGTQPYVDGDWYVGYKAGDLEIGLDPNGKSVVCYIDTDDIEASLKALKDAGAEVVMQPKDVGGGLQVAQVEQGGNVLGLRMQPKK